MIVAVAPVVVSQEPVRITLVKTTLGPLATIENRRGLAQVQYGASLAQLRDLLRPRYSKIQWAEASPITDVLLAYTQGEAVDWTRVPLDLTPLTDFRSRVTAACQRIPHGSTSTYRDLAAEVGQIHASRAVGRVMATNPWPIIVPCHRVLRSDGGLGGYTAPAGLTLKKKLLHLEQQPARKPSNDRQIVLAWSDDAVSAAP